MQSLFGRSFRHRSKPYICRKPPPPGPLVDAWPPPWGAALIIFDGTQPGGELVHAGGFVMLPYRTTFRRYSGFAHDADVTLEISVEYHPNPSGFTWFAGFVQAATLLYEAEGPLTPAKKPDDIHITQTVPTDETPNVTCHLSFDAYTLI